jgi:TPP-dependent pyruvate/acetoin dehydrogenase alpha subunit
MLMMRRFEEKLIGLAERKVLTSTYHVYIGQESVGAGVMEALRPEDRILTTHRNHGHVIARGADPARAFAEILGRSTGLCGGKGGSFHLSDASLGFLQTSAILGGAIGLAMGAAYGLKQLRSNGVAVAFFGDGSLDEGVAGEAMNAAAINKLPLVFVLENNNRPRELSQRAGSNTAIRSFLDIPRLYGIEAVRLGPDADVHAIAEVTRAALARAQSGGGPTFIEAAIAYWPGLSEHVPKLVTGVTDLRMAWDPALIGGEHADWIAKYDPVLRYAREALASRATDQAALLALDGRVRERIELAAASALESPYPDKEAAYADVFA